MNLWHFHFGNCFKVQKFMTCVQLQLHSKADQDECRLPLISERSQGFFDSRLPQYYPTAPQSVYKRPGVKVAPTAGKAWRWAQAEVEARLQCALTQLLPSTLAKARPPGPRSLMASPELPRRPLHHHPTQDLRPHFSSFHARQRGRQEGRRIAAAAHNRNCIFHRLCQNMPNCRTLIISTLLVLQLFTIVLLLWPRQWRE